MRAAGSENSARPAAKAGQSGLSRLAAARKAKEQSQPDGENAPGNDWFGTLRSEAAAVPIPENDEDEDAPMLPDEGEAATEVQSGLLSELGLGSLALDDFSEGTRFEPGEPADEYDGLRSRFQTGPLFAPEPEQPFELSALPDETSTEPLFSADGIDYSAGASDSADFDPRQRATSALPDWLRELNPNKVEEDTAEPFQSPANFNSFQAEPALPELDLKPFELSEKPSAQPRRETTAPIEEDIGGVPDWLREISGTGEPSTNKPTEAVPEWQQELQSQNTTRPQIEGDVPDWLHDISAQTGMSRNPSRPTFGDAEVEATLSFAFGDEREKKSYEEPDELPDLSPDIAKSLPPEALRTGLTGNLDGNSENEFKLPSFLSEPPTAEPALQQTQPDTLFIEETPQGEEVPFELPPLPDLGEMGEMEGAEEVSFEQAAETSPLWGAGLPVWLQNLTPPTLAPDYGEAAYLSDLPVVIGVPEAGIDEETFAAPLPPDQPLESQVAAMFDEQTPRPGYLTGQELGEAAKTDSSTRFKETRPFSLRDVLRQTGSLADRFGEDEPKQENNSENFEATLSETRFDETDLPLASAIPFSVQDTDTNYNQDYSQVDAQDAAQNLDDLPEWLRNTVGSNFEANAAEPAQVDEPDMPDWLLSQPATANLPDFALPENAETDLPDLPDFALLESAENNLPDLPRFDFNEPAHTALFSSDQANEDPIGKFDVNEPTNTTPTHTFEPEPDQSFSPFDFAEPQIEKENQIFAPEPNQDFSAFASQIEPEAFTPPLETKREDKSLGKPFFVPSLPPMDDELEDDEGELQPFDLTQFEAQELPESRNSSTGLFNTKLGLGEPDEEQLPDWLNNSATPAPMQSQPLTFEPEFSPAPEPQYEPEPPQFEAFAEPEPALELESATFAPAPESGEAEEMPPWLQDMVMGKASPPTATPSATKAEPRYSSMFAGVSRAEEEQVNLPDWLKTAGPPANLEAATAVPETPAPDPVANDNVEVERLLQSLNTAEPAGNNPPAGMPEWLQGSPATAAPTFDLPEDLPDWLKNEAATAPEIPTQSEGDLTPAHPLTPPNLGQDTLPLNNFNQELNQANTNLPSSFLEGVEGPAWLRGTTASQPNPSAASAQPQATMPLPPPLPGMEILPVSGLNPTALPGWLRTVGSATLDQETASNEPFTVPGALPQVALPATLASAGVLAALLGPQAVASSPITPIVSAPPKAATNLGLAALSRYLLYVLLLGVALFGVLQPISSPVLPVTPPVQSFYTTVSNLTPNSKVLVAYDWEGDRSGEMRPMATAVTQQIMSRRARLATISLNSQGPALASQITEEVASDPAYGNNATGLYEYGTGYVNLGWRLGSEAAIRGLFNDMGSIRDYKQNRLASEIKAMDGINSLNDFDLVIVLAGDEGSVRNWVEQFGVRPNAQLLYGVPAAVAPMARPYLLGPSSAQPNLSSNYSKVLGLLEGLNGTAQYQQLLRDNNIKADSKLSLDSRLFAQSLAAILLILAVIVANIVYFVRKSRK